MSGYVRIYRDLIGHVAFRNDAEAMTFAWMVVRASWKPARVRYKGKAITLDRGQLAVSVRDLADAMDRDKAWIERLLSRLKTETMIDTSSETGVNVITICNYADYQAETETREIPSETLDETDVRQTRDTEQEDNNTSEPKGSSVVRLDARKAFACPEGVEPQHWRDFLANRKRRRLTNNPTAYEGQLRALAQLSDDEWPPGRLVQHAAEKGWGSINDPRSSERNYGTRKPDPQHLRGSRPDPALDLGRLADAEIEAERSAGHQEADFGAGAALPSYLTG